MIYQILLNFFWIFFICLNNITYFEIFDLHGVQNFVVGRIVKTLLVQCILFATIISLFLLHFIYFLQFCVYISRELQTWNWHFTFFQCEDIFFCNLIKHHEWIFCCVSCNFFGFCYCVKFYSGISKRKNWILFCCTFCVCLCVFFYSQFLYLKLKTWPHSFN